MLRSSTQLQNRSVHVVVRTRTFAKCKKMKNTRTKRAKLLFSIVKYANLCRSCSRRRRGYLTSLVWLVKWSRKNNHAARAARPRKNFWRRLSNNDVEFSYTRFWRQRELAAANLSFSGFPYENHSWLASENTLCLLRTTWPTWSSRKTLKHGQSSILRNKSLTIDGFSGSVESICKCYFCEHSYKFAHVLGSRKHLVSNDLQCLVKIAEKQRQRQVFSHPDSPMASVSFSLQQNVYIFLRLLKRAGVAPKELVHIYLASIRSFIEYATPAWFFPSTGHLIAQLEQEPSRWSFHLPHKPLESTLSRVDL